MDLNFKLNSLQVYWADGREQLSVGLYGMRVKLSCYSV